LAEENITRNEVYEIWVLLHQTRDAIATARENELKETGISMIQAAVLFIVNAIPGPATPNEIARWIFRTPQTVHVVLKQMEKQGLVRRRKNLKRKNLVHISLTKKGEKALAESQEKLGVIGEILSCLPKEERSQFYTSLGKLRASAFTKIKTEGLPFPEASERQSN